jgi:hypothetical protein
MPRLRQNDRERTVGIEQCEPKFGRLLDQVLYGQCLQPLSYGSGGEKGVIVCHDVVTSHTACRYGVCYSSYLGFVYASLEASHLATHPF